MLAKLIPWTKFLVAAIREDSTNAIAYLSTYKPKTAPPSSNFNSEKEDKPLVFEKTGDPFANLYTDAEGKDLYQVDCQHRLGNVSIQCFITFYGLPWSDR